MKRWHLVIYAEGPLDVEGVEDAEALSRSFVETLRTFGHDVRAAELSDLPDGTASVPRDIAAPEPGADLTIECAAPERIMRHFTSEDVPERARPIGAGFDDLARRITSFVGRGPERSKSLSKLLESKDAACRAVKHGDR